MIANDNKTPIPEQINDYYVIEKDKFRDAMIKLWNIQYAIKLGIIKS